jgi:hypothetical protein
VKHKLRYVGVCLLNNIKKDLEENMQYAAALKFTYCDGSLKLALPQFSEPYVFSFIVLQTPFLKSLQYAVTYFSFSERR